MQLLHPCLAQNCAQDSTGSPPLSTPLLLAWFCRIYTHYIQGESVCCTDSQRPTTRIISPRGSTMTTHVQGGGVLNTTMQGTGKHLPYCYSHPSAATTTLMITHGNYAKPTFMFLTHWGRLGKLRDKLSKRVDVQGCAGHMHCPNQLAAASCATTAFLLQKLPPTHTDT